MRIKSITLLGISILILISGCASIKNANDITQENLADALSQSEKRIEIVTSNFHNGKYHGDLPIDDAIKIITEEIEVQKILYKKYSDLSKERKSDKRIYMKFFQLGKYGWAPEKSILNVLSSSDKR